MEFLEQFGMIYAERDTNSAERLVMPIYRFICADCGARFEKQLEFDQVNSEQICPNGHKKVRKVFFSPAIVYKGSGWYSTDHRASY